MGFKLNNKLINQLGSHYIPSGPARIKPGTEGQLLGHPEPNAGEPVVLSDEVLGVVVPELYPGQSLT